VAMEVPLFQAWGAKSVCTRLYRSGRLAYLRDYAVAGVEFWRYNNPARQGSRDEQRTRE